jgi:hypothetical protein
MTLSGAAIVRHARVRGFQAAACEVKDEHGWQGPSTDQTDQFRA